MPDMRFAPAPAVLARSVGGGLNQTTVRTHNECLVLDLLRREGTLSRFEIGQRTGLSAQTVSVLVRSLRNEELLLEQATSRGRIGPPTTPFALNPDGAFAIGVYAGVEVIDICVVDFHGRLRVAKRRRVSDSTGIARQIVELVPAFLGDLEPLIGERCLGVGLAVNRRHWPESADADNPGWNLETGLQTVEQDLTEITGLVCYILDDKTSAATGQVLYGEATSGGNFLYVHVGSETQMTVVLNGQAQVGYGRHRMPIPGLSDLETRLSLANLAHVDVWNGDPLPREASQAFRRWAGEVVRAVGSVAAGLLPLLDVPVLIMSTSLSRPDAELVEQELRSVIDEEALEVEIAAAYNSSWAKASGAAARILSSRFTPSKNED